MEFSFKKACPHCNQRLKFRVGDNYKKSISCNHCNQQLGFHCPQYRYFYGFSVCFWITVAFFLLKAYPVLLISSALLLIISAIFTSLPISDLVKGEEKKFRSFYTALQMMLLGVIVNSAILTLGIFVYTRA